MTEIIDAHSHVWTSDTERYPLAAGFGRRHTEPLSFTAEELQQHMSLVGVKRAVLIQPDFYGYDNSYIADVIREHPGMFAGVTVVDQDGRESNVEMRKLKGLGFHGFRIYPKNQPVESWLCSKSMRTMWATGAEEELAMCCLIDPDALPAVDRMCSDFPDTPVVIDHFARIGAGGPIKPRDVETLCNMSRHGRVFIKVSAFYALGRKQPPYSDLVPMISAVYDAFGAQRLMWGSDSPFQVLGEHTYRQSVDLIREKLDFLSGDDKEWLLWRAAEKVFFQDRGREIGKGKEHG